MRLALFFTLVWPCFLAGCQWQLMPTPNLYLNSSVNPFAEVPEPLRSNQVEVLYATDRAPKQSTKVDDRYGFLRSRSLAFGTCVVEIGRNVAWEDLVRESRSNRRSIALPLRLLEIREILRFPDSPEVLIQSDGQLVENPKLIAERNAVAGRMREILQQRLALTPQKHAYVFVHGFNNDFEDGAFVIAQLWHFMGRTGVPILYSWPAGSGASQRGYAYDRESGEFTIFHLKQFLRELAACPDLEKIHLIAHSRGTDVVMTALRELHIQFRAAGQDTRSALKLGNLVLAAPDLDIEVALQRIGAERLHLVPERLTVYLSTQDRAIGFANWLFSSIRRLGQLRSGDLTKQQREVLALLTEFQLVDAQVNTDFVGHSYFYSNPAVSSDLILVLRHELAAGEKHGRPLRHRLDNFWEIRDRYLLND